MATTESAWPFKRYIMVVWACLECLLLAGLAMGWYSLVYVLQKEKFFLDYCDDTAHHNVTSIQEYQHNFTYGLYSISTTHSRHKGPVDGTGYNVTGIFPGNESSDLSTDERCAKQDEMFALVFTVATTLLALLAPIFGHIQYKLGTRVTRIVMIAIILIGSLSLAFMTVDTPWLSFIGLTFMASGGLPILTTNTQIANLFPTGASTVVCLLSGSFDTSTSMQVLIKIGFENGVSRRISYLIVSALTIMLVISTFIFLPKGFIEKAKDETPAPVLLVSHSRTEGGGDIDDFEDTQINNNRDEDLGRNPGLVNKSSPIPSLKQCLLSRMFITHTIWLSLLQLRFLYYLGTLNLRLNSLTNNSVHGVSHYTNMCLYIQFGGVITALLSGVLMDLEKKRFSKCPSLVQRQLLPMVLPLILASVLAVILSGISMGTSEDILIPSFVLLTAYRSIMYGAALGFLQYVFPIQYMALMYGVMFVVSGIVNTLQYPLFIWNEKPPLGYVKVEGFLMALVILTLIHPGYLCWASHRAGKGRRTPETDIIEAGGCEPSDLAQPFNKTQDKEEDKVL